MSRPTSSAPGEERRGPGPNARPYRKASEIGAFLYCRRAWWLRHGLGLPPGNAEARARGEAAHDRMGRQVEGAAASRRLALVLVLAALALLVWAMFLG